MAGKTTKTRFWHRWDGDLLIRRRHEAAVPEVLRSSGSWDPFPMFDPYHKDEGIPDELAVKHARAETGDDSLTVEDLQGEPGPSAPAPVRP